MWLHQSDQLEALAHKVDVLRLTRLEAGVFQLIVSPYEAVVDQVVSRCREGQQRMEDIASALRQVADTYDSEDLASAHRFHY